LAAALHRDGTINQRSPEKFVGCGSNHTNSGTGSLAYKIPLFFDSNYLPQHVRLSENEAVATYKWRPAKYVGQSAGSSVLVSNDTRRTTASAKFTMTSPKLGEYSSRITEKKRAALKMKPAPSTYAERVCTVVGTQVGGYIVLQNVQLMP
jgi:hypothetical protein